MLNSKECKEIDVLSSYAGSFSITMGRIDDDNVEEILMEHIFSKMIIVKAEVNLATGCVDYIAFSRHYFDKLDVGEAIPAYKFKFNTEYGTVIEVVVERDTLIKI